MSQFMHDFENCISSKENIENICKRSQIFGGA